MSSLLILSYEMEEEKEGKEEEGKEGGREGKKGKEKERNEERQSDSPCAIRLLSQEHPATHQPPTDTLRMLLRTTAESASAHEGTDVSEQLQLTNGSQRWL